MSKEPISEFKFEEAPGTPKYDWFALAEQCKGAPMEWVVLFERDRTSYVETIKQGALRAMPPGSGFEVRTRFNRRDINPETDREVRTCKAWVRYNPALDTITVKKKTRARKKT